MSVKEFFKERAERKRLIDEVRGVLVDGSDRAVRRYKKQGLSSAEDVLVFFLSLGNMVFRSGDPEVFSHYLKSLFEVVDSDGGREFSDRLLRRARYFGLKTIRDRDVELFAEVIGGFGGHLGEVREGGLAVYRLQVLKGLALETVLEGFEPGVLEVVGVLGDLDDRFRSERLEVSGVYLKNLVISFVRTVEARGDESLMGRVVSVIGGIVGFDGPEGVEPVQGPAPEGAEAPSSVA